MKCPKCQTISPKGSKFCGMCGAALDPELDPLRIALKSSVRPQLQAESNEGLPGQNPTAQARRYAVWMAVPSLALLLLVLFFGLRSYHNVTAQLETARQDLDARITQLRKERDAAERAHAALQADYVQLRQAAPKQATLGPILRQEVQAALNEKLKDAKVFEIESAEVAKGRVTAWAKDLGYVVGIPLGILAVVLGMVGIKTISDLKTLADRARETAENDLRHASDRVAQIVKQINERAERVRAEFDDLLKLADQVRGLSSRVAHIEQKVQVETPSGLAPDVTRKIESSLAALREFQDYMQKLGFKPEAKEIKLKVAEKLEFETAIAYYYENAMHVQSAYVGDTDIIFREYAHHVLVEGRSQMDTWYMAIESGLANYFACSFNNDPLVGDQSAGLPGTEKGCFFNLANDQKFQVKRSDDHFHDGEAWGGAFWKLRALLGKEADEPHVWRADRVLYAAWAAMKPEGMKIDRGRGFVRQLLERHAATPGDVPTEKIRAIFEERGLKL